ncbi:uncharacterized protein At2g33490-like isoform X2 [Cynara cardunculus var. scolymus]|uniref:uncharacterized protein At2g33490-like isoform X2 n=1 Tax=Cynara cardunculus var. scolymus TaxID=59895 RepID=UPI000D62C285|nr:uncharacterized protein At2g33490-like isoform X2 [Cynara cardunculus var. scolymus]
MKSSLGKLGRKLSINRSDGKDKRDHQPSAHLEDLAHASKDMQDMRNCYDTLLSAAAATANSIYEFSESLHEMGTCLLDKTAVDADDESGRVLSALGNMQSELQKIADSYRSYVILTVTNPTESLLSELRKVEEMKLQCDEKRDAYEYMMAQHREKGRLRSGKVETSVVQKLQEAQDEYDVVARLCAFRVKSLKEGQCRSLLTQAARHHAAQLNFFRKGLKALEAVDPYIRFVAEKHRIDFQLSGLNAGAAAESEGISSYESTDDGELSFDYRQKKQGIDNVATSSNLDRVDNLYPQVSNLADSEINVNKYQGERQGRVSSYSAPIYPESKIDPSGKLKEMKFYSYVLPPPVVDTKSPSSNLHQPLAVELKKHERDTGDEVSSTSTSAKAWSVEKERFSFPQQRDTHTGKAAKRQAYSGPLPPGKMASSNSRPITTSSSQARSVSPPPLSSPKISELHELPRPPTTSLSRPLAASASFSSGHSAPLFFKNQNKMLTSPLPPPPLVVSRSFSIPSTNQRGKVGSPPLTPISLANIKSLSTVDI